MENVREILCEEDKLIFDKIENHTLLGASNHINVIGKMIENIAKKNIEPDIKLKQIHLVCDYYISTRGKASQAINNAILEMLSEINSIDKNDIHFIDKIVNVKNHFDEKAKLNLKKIIDYAVEYSKDYKKILAYDYSSTIVKFLEELSKDNEKRILYIAESRIIDGGYPFVKALIDNKNYDIHVIPDCSMQYYMKDIDACYMGAETLYADGTGFNTTGSDIVGLICKYYNKPLYFITPMIKLDIRNLYGYQKKLVIDDLKNKLTKEWDKSLNYDNIKFITPELVGVKPEFITAFITEYGIIPPYQMLGTAKEYMSEIERGKPNE